MKIASMGRIMASHLFSLAITMLMLVISSHSFSTIETNPPNSSFKINLIHRDSPLSPFHNPSLSHEQRLANALQRSNHRAYHLKPNRDVYHTNILPDGGEFLMNISLGTPPRQVLVVADTGSDLTWIQCHPCTDCYKHTGRLFNPKMSSTYKPLACNSKTCKESFGQCSSRKNSTCGYLVSYADGSNSTGDVATETVTFSSDPFSRIMFGCGFSNQGLFSPNWGGIVGLGGGNLSLISQLHSLIKGRFSYCLIPNPTLDDQHHKSSKFNFGGMVTGEDTVSTPIVLKSLDGYYYLTLEGISVGHRRINVTNPYFSTNFSSNVSHEGNIIIDSGTTVTYLPRHVYYEVETSIKHFLKTKTIHDPTQALNLCFRSSKVTRVPIITVHFKGADVKLNKLNIFVETRKDVLCLAFAPTKSLPIYGNLAQMNFMVGYDLEKKIVSFKPADCTKH